MVTSAVTVAAFLPPIASALRERGATVEVASAGATGVTGMDNVVLHDLPLERSGNPVSFLKAVLAAIRLVRARKPDVLVCATPVASLLGVMVGRLLRVPKVVHLAWGLRSQSLAGVPRALVGLAEKVTVRGAHLTLANSESLRRAITGLDRRVADKVECLGAGSSHGVDLERFVSREPPVHEVPVVGFVGRVRADKGIYELLDAVERLQCEGFEFELLITGTLEDEALRPRLDQAKNVRCQSHTDDVPELMGAIDVLVLPSWREGFPNVVLEASASARPVITTDATGAVDSVRHEETGLIARARDVDSLTNALRSLLERPDERVRMGVAGRRWVEESFESGFVCRRLAARIVGVEE